MLGVGRTELPRRVVLAGRIFAWVGRMVVGKEEVAVAVDCSKVGGKLGSKPSGILVDTEVVREQVGPVGVAGVVVRT